MNMLQLQNQWTQLDARLQRLLQLALAVVILALLWWGLLGPVWRVSQTGAAQLQAVNAQIQSMTALAAEAKALQAKPQWDGVAASAWLEASAKKWGAQVQTQGDTVIVNFKAVASSILVTWLKDAKTLHQLTPTSAQWRLTSVSAANSGAAAGVAAGTAPRAPASDAEPKWDGTVQFTVITVVKK